MSVELPRNLFSQIHEDPTVNPASRRKVVLPRVTRQILENQGYVFGDKIRVPGGYAFEVTDPDGKNLRLGLKTAVNRWLNTATTLVKMVDRVIVTTFEWDVQDEKPEKFELVEIASPVLLDIIGKVRDEAKSRGEDPQGHHYVPLDKKSLDKQTGCIAGAIIPVGRVIFGPVNVIWTDDEWGRFDTGRTIERPEPVSAAPLDIAAIVAEAKTTLAARLGVTADKIDLTIRL